MPSKYIPTGRPRGRPRKDAAPAVAPAPASAPKKEPKKPPPVPDPTATFAPLPEENLAQAVELAKRSLGRPPSYRPEYCERVMELGAEGKSLAQIGCEIGHLRDTLRDWAGKYPDFGRALARARELSLAWWEAQAKIGMWDGSAKGRLNAHVWLKSMAARFPDDYRESTRTEITGKDGGPVNVVSMSDVELLAIAASGKAPAGNTQGNT